ncbi:MAG: gamma-glutamyl-gamma-aminobutyrate hydrolase family protein [Candidatus Neomarinimicrobiota bacterium]|jgi:putative glutamine amidotransferase|nr:gamma-glutamyl-gamma-aminobutyrate hydrolase family protein [bacterium]
MKTRILLLLLVFLLIACSGDREPLIGLSMDYRQNHYSIHKTYVDAVRENGGRVRLIPCSDDEALLRKELKEIDGIILIGGQDYDPAWYGKTIHPSMSLMDPHRGRFDSLFVHLALESGKPILGVCAGEQLLNIATGGKLIRDIPGHRGTEHMIYIESDSRLQALYGDSLLVNSWHHQCVEPGFLNPDFRITAWSADSIVEAVEYTGRQWILGTQFHPERLPCEQRDRMFSLFIREAAK